MTEQLDTPELPPSDLICTPQEWANAFEAGKQARQRGDVYRPLTGKFKSPWIAGWDSTTTF
jgi:hypothetical protein